MQRIRPFLWFNDNAEQAVKFYASVFPKSKIGSISRYGKTGPGKPGSVMTIDFHLLGEDFVALNGGPDYPFTPAVSFVVDCATQKEVDYYWRKLSAGGKKIQCGWLVDKFGLSWQVVPEALYDLMTDPDPKRSERVMAAMLQMVKLDLRKLQRAADRN